jgi:hypothetical protein
MIEIHRKGFSIRIYEDSRPHHYKSTGIQKGLILVYNNQEVSGEGIGFGAPVVKYSDKTYFPRDARLTVLEENGITDIVKEFEINSVFRVKIFGKHIKSQMLYSFTEFFSKIHREHKSIRWFLDIILAIVRKILGRPSDLVIASQKGKITVNYQILDDSILVRVDSTKLDKTDCEEICIMNEQGADFFRKYTDTDGVLLIDDQIPSWEKIQAKEARFSDTQDNIGFGLSNISGVSLYRGRERFDGHLAWTGFAYSVPPEMDVFEYTIKILVK